MAPVFSMVLDEDVSADIALMYPELYQELMKVSQLYCTDVVLLCVVLIHIDRVDR